MQLKIVGESLNVTNTINDIIKSSLDLNGAFSANEVLSKNLAVATKGYSLEAVKMAIAESTLNEEQIRSILIKQGLQGEILETTTAELAQVTSTNALSASQEAAAATTMGFGNAMKGLGVSIKNLM